MEIMKLFVITFIATCCHLTAAKDSNEGTYSAPHSFPMEASVPTNDAHEMESCGYMDSYDYEGSIDLTDYESNANIGSEGDLVDDISPTDAPSSLQDAQDRCSRDRSSHDQCKDPCAQNCCEQERCSSSPPRKPRASVRQAVIGFAWRKDNVTY